MSGGSPVPPATGSSGQKSAPGAGGSSAPPPPNTLDDYVRSAVAIAIVFGGLATIISFWVFRSVQDAEALSAVMTGLIGGVTGYYFGAQGKQQALQTASQATTNMVATKKKARTALATAAAARGTVQAHPAGGEIAQIATKALQEVEAALNATE